MFVNQSEIHSPGVNTNTFYGISFLCSQFQSGLHIFEQGREIPVDMISYFDLPVGDAVYLFQLQFAMVKEAGDNPSTSASEVCC